MYKMIFSEEYLLNNMNIFNSLDDDKNEIYILIRELIIIDIINHDEKDNIRSCDITDVWFNFFKKHENIFPTYFFLPENENNSKLKIKTKLTNIVSSNSERIDGLKKKKRN
ncbi:hypothetical protein [[Acholeplasma] multilocale]|uniref:hypothetical protein n=1 Tax=[Acholeplasma] multilocale TaxID=264638 RepID=UPI00047E18BF|nr:hypothetical protein [[Acholeplasma] multilocale]